MNRTLFLTTFVVLTLTLSLVVQPVAASTPGIQILSPMQGATVMGPNVTFSFLVTNFILSPAEIGMLPVPGHGHLHVILDGTLAVITADGTHTLMGLMPGMHTVRVELHQNNHLLLTPPVDATVTFTVM